MTLIGIAQRETASESGGQVKGVAVARVTQNKDPDGLCRVKVSYPWHEQPRESYWARIAGSMAGKDRGFVLIPEIGDEVLVAFEREDLRFPYVLGALWNDRDAPPESNRDGRNDKRIFKSRKGHCLSFDDGARGVVELVLNDGKKVSLDDDGIRIEDGHGSQLAIDSKSGAVTLKAAGKLTLKAASIVLETSGTLEIKAGATLTLCGAPVNIN